MQGKPCAIDDCERFASGEIPFCDDCWRKVPLDIKRQLQKYKNARHRWKTGVAPEYANAIRAAVIHVAERKQSAAYHKAQRERKLRRR